MEEPDILVALAGIITLFVLLAAGIIAFAILYSNKARRHQKALQDQERQQQLELLSAAISAQELERERIGADIHDDIGPMLATTRLMIHKFKYLTDREEVINHIHRLEDQLDRAIDRVREVAKNLVPQILVEFGLIAAIQDLCKSINESENIKAAVVTGSGLPAFSRSQELALYRIIQEFCANTLNHARATRIDIQFMPSEKGMTIELLDDGIGINREQLQKKGGFGLQNMDARARSIGARMQVDHERKSGARILISLSASQ